MVSEKIFEIVDEDEIPTTVRRTTGIYAEIEKTLMTLPHGKCVKVTVDKRTTANGYSSHFPRKGYRVITRKRQDGRFDVFICKK